MKTERISPAPVDFVVGIDLGQAQDYTAVAVVERAHGFYSVRRLDRYRGRPYPAIVDDVVELLSNEKLIDRATVVVDQTGVGRPVVDLLRQAGVRPLYAVTITGGTEVVEVPDGYRVPKRELASAVAVALQSHKLAVAASLPLASVLVEELRSFRVKLSATGQDTYEAWREKDHDDLVLALSLAVWAGGVLPVHEPSLTPSQRRDRFIAQRIAKCSDPTSASIRAAEAALEWQEGNAPVFLSRGLAARYRWRRGR